MNKKGKIISAILSLLFITAGIWVYYLLNNIPDYFYSQLSEKGIILMLHSLLFLGCLTIVYNFIYFKSDQEVIFLEKPIYKNKESAVAIENNHSESASSKKGLLLLQNEIKTIINTNHTIEKKTDKILSLICNNLEACQGIIYKLYSKTPQPSLSPFASYAYVPPENKIVEYHLGEGLIGVSAKEDRKLIINDIPEGYIKITSGLGKSSPSLIAIYPLKHQNTVTGILELALFTNLDNNSNEVLEEIINELGLLVA